MPFRQVAPGLLKKLSGDDTVLLLRQVFHQRFAWQWQGQVDCFQLDHIRERLEPRKTGLRLLLNVHYRCIWFPIYTMEMVVLP